MNGDPRVALVSGRPGTPGPRVFCLTFSPCPLPEMQEAALQLAAKAVANADHEFGLELCKRAGSVIYDPRLCAMAGECYELKVSGQQPQLPRPAFAHC
jgi:hypothetical protein